MLLKLHLFVTTMNSNDFDDPLNFPRAQQAGFRLSSEITQHLQDGMARNLLSPFIVCGLE